jgi:hypothetical protein
VAQGRRARHPRTGPAERLAQFVGVFAHPMPDPTAMLLPAKTAALISVNNSHRG